MVTDMFASLENNDLASLKLFLDENGGDINSYVNSIEYSYNVVPQIFDGNTEDGVRQINPDTTFSAFGMGSGSSNALMSSMYSTDVFSEMMGNTSIVEEQYDVRRGAGLPPNNECVVVLTANGTVPDLVSYALGLLRPCGAGGYDRPIYERGRRGKPRRRAHLHLRRHHGRVTEDGARCRLLHLR